LTDYMEIVITTVICGKLPVNETVETLARSSRLTVDWLEFKHHMQVMMEYCCIGKGILPVKMLRR
jgi:hypothetical protein